jgi:hypothetical protein
MAFLEALDHGRAVEVAVDDAVRDIGQVPGLRRSRHRHLVGQQPQAGIDGGIQRIEDRRAVAPEVVHVQRRLKRRRRVGPDAVVALRHRVGAIVVHADGHG